MHKVLVSRLFKLAMEESVARSTDHPDMTIAVDLDVKQQTKPKHKKSLKKDKKMKTIKTNRAFYK